MGLYTIWKYVHLHGTILETLEYKKRPPTRSDSRLRASVLSVICQNSANVVESTKSLGHCKIRH